MRKNFSLFGVGLGAADSTAAVWLTDEQAKTKAGQGIAASRAFERCLVTFRYELSQMKSSSNHNLDFKEVIMQLLNVKELELVNGGCARYCWGNQSWEDTFGGALGGAIAGSRGGWIGAGLGAVGGVVAVFISNLNDNAPEVQQE